MNAEKIINAVKQLSREDKIEFAKSLLQPVEPRKDRTFNLPQALKDAAQLPAAYRYPICKFLLEADQIFQDGRLSSDDIANMAAVLLYMTQDHSDQQEGYAGLKIAHDFQMQANLQKVLNG